MPGVGFFFCCLVYIFSTLHGTVTPSAVTWILWTLINVLAAVSVIPVTMEMCGKASVYMVVAWVVKLLTYWTIIILALILGNHSVGFIEGISIAGAIIGTALWKWKKMNSAIEVAFFVGALPTFFNAYANPVSENSFAWSMWLIICLVDLWRIKKERKKLTENQKVEKEINFCNARHVIFLTTIGAVMVILVVVRPFFL